MTPRGYKCHAFSITNSLLSHKTSNISNNIFTIHLVWLSIDYDLIIL